MIAATMADTAAEVSAIEVKKVKKVIKKKKSVTIDDKITIEGERRDSGADAGDKDKVPVAGVGRMRRG